jgi:hypothetical protein
LILSVTLRCEVAPLAVTVWKPFAPAVAAWMTPLHEKVPCAVALAEQIVTDAG